MTNNKDIKHTKYEKDWNEKIEQLSSSVDKKQIIKSLNEQRTEIVKHRNQLIKEKKLLEREKKSLQGVFVAHRYLERQKQELETNKAALKTKWKNFIDGATISGTDHEGWNDAIQKHYPSTYPNNLYAYKNGTSEDQITEEQVINTIARIVKALEKADLEDFCTKYDAKNNDQNHQRQVRDYLRGIQIQAQHIIIGSNKDEDGNSKQASYDFANTYQKYDKSSNTWTDYVTEEFNYQNFFDFISLVHNQPFLNDLQADKHSQVPTSEKWKVFGKGEVWSADVLKDYGIILVDSTKTTLYKTGTQFREFTVNNGIKGWLELAKTIASDDNRNKIVTSFTKSPQQSLLGEIKNWRWEQGTLQNDNFTLGDPEKLIEEAEIILAQLSDKKTTSAASENALNRQIQDKQDKLNTKQQELDNKEKEINDITDQILTKKREELQTHQISKGFELIKKTDGTIEKDNRRTQLEINTICQILVDIRYLKSGGDTTIDTEITQENSAFTKLKEIKAELTEINATIYSDWIEVAETDEARITHLKNNQGLTTVYQAFLNKEAKVKLSERETKSLDAIKVILEQEEGANDTLETYQSKLKALNPLLDETIITQEVVDDWKAHQNFKSSEKVKNEIAKVLKAGKLDVEFQKLMTKEDAELTDLAKLFKKKKAKDIITLIRFWEYEQLTESDKKDKKNV